MPNLLQRDRPMPQTPPMLYPALKGRIVETRGFLQGLRPDELVSVQAHKYEWRPPIVRGWFGGDDYIRHLVIPDFFFHVATSHAILRHLGAPIGKRDYFGNLSGQSGGGYS
jgi:hypothetical protein